MILKTIANKLLMAPKQKWLKAYAVYSAISNGIEEGVRKKPRKLRRAEEYKRIAKRVVRDGGLDPNDRKYPTPDAAKKLRRIDPRDEEE